MNFNLFEIFGPGIIVLVPAFAAGLAFSVAGIITLVEKVAKKK